MRQNELWQVKFGNVCAGVEVHRKSKIVVCAAPVLRRFIGRPWSELWHWVVYRRNGKVRRVDANTEA